MTTLANGHIPVQTLAPVLENQQVARSTYRLRFRSKHLAEQLRPAQFVMVRLPGRTDPLLGRAFACFDVMDDTVDIVFLVVGKMTTLLSRLRAGDRVSVWGPLGLPFPSYEGVDHLCLVAGGIGQTPFLTLLRRVLGQSGFAGEPARREVKRVSFFYGARSGDYFACLDAFQQTGATIHLATEDGSAGFAGYVTNLLDQKRVDGEQERTRWVGCGPEPMLHALASLAHARGIGCDVSLETPMACGVGICFSCVTKVKTTDGFDYRRTCVEGPIFDAAKLVW